MVKEVESEQSMLLLLVVMVSVGFISLDEEEGIDMSAGLKVAG